jgi:hypothetical protein
MAYCLGCGQEVGDSEVIGGGHVVTLSAHAGDDSCRRGECANCPVPEQNLCGPVESDEEGAAAATQAEGRSE